MKVLNIEEHADGSATLHLEMTDKEVERILIITDYKFNIEHAILHILEESIKDMVESLKQDEIYV